MPLARDIGGAAKQLLAAAQQVAPSSDAPLHRDAVAVRQAVIELVKSGKERMECERELPATGDALREAGVGVGLTVKALLASLSE